jgi:hypothetical protein
MADTFSLTLLIRRKPDVKFLAYRRLKISAFIDTRKLSQGATNALLVRSASLDLRPECRSGVQARRTAASSPDSPMLRLSRTSALDQIPRDLRTSTRTVLKPAFGTPPKASRNACGTAVVVAYGSAPDTKMRLSLNRLMMGSARTA